MIGIGIMWLGLVGTTIPGQEKTNRRFGIDEDSGQYSQKSPPEALASVIKAIQFNRIDYLLAHLADPEFVDKRMAEYTAILVGGEAARTTLGFNRFLKETTDYYKEDPLLLKELRDFFKENSWEIEESKAVAKHKDIPTRKIFMKRIGDRWFLENKQK
jgi:hypothetical protein